MSRRAITTEFYNQLLAAFRLPPGNYSQAAKMAHCTRATAKRAWERGWSCAANGLSIRDVLSREVQTARAGEERVAAARIEGRAEVAADMLDAARQDAVDRRKQLLQIGKAMRGTAAMGLAALQRFGQALVRVSESIGSPEGLEALLKASPVTKMRLVTEYTRAAKDVAVVYETLHRMTRLDEELPTEIVNIQAEMSLEQAMQLIRDAREWDATMREHGLIEAHCEGVPPDGLSH